MISIAQAIVDVNTVMIEFLHASPAHLTVESPHRLDHLAIETEILKINILFIAYLKDLEPVECGPYIAWLHVVAHKEENE